MTEQELWKKWLGIWQNKDQQETTMVKEDFMRDLKSVFDEREFMQKQAAACLKNVAAAIEELASVTCEKSADQARSELQSASVQLSQAVDRIKSVTIKSKGIENE